MKGYWKTLFTQKGLAILGNILFIAGFLTMVYYFIKLIPQWIV